MWLPSPAADGNSNAKIKARFSSSSSSFSRSSSSFSSSSFSSVPVPPAPKRKSMEEVWKHIDLSTLAHESQPPTTVCSDQHHFNMRRMILQDFLASAFESQPRSPVANELPQFPLPPTALSLSNGMGGPIAPLKLPLHAATSMSAKKHPLDDVCSNSKDDRHLKRMMKNRESAARSRARKQAYTNELELEVANRAEENARLKKQNEELRKAIAAQIPKKDFLQRTSSAPF
ncbi:LOW QUALITY PROTEIN: protein FD-like [Phalaenopsis equestris]|uniref:LOW QUALITY PROTEIN: protein FD-like n=1 Tax=Phalaenopsis equestris TaxID=78828 RepID=UPI0009E48666|nr:LOW QUALITY PROTEIN: protein FD-like [Phalaenopsis equestris]